MSLRAFHLFFIALSVVLAAFVATWASGQYRTEQQIGYVVAALGSALAGLLLVVYGTRFQRRTRNL